MDVATQSINVLLVEDNDDHAELVAYAMKKGGLTCSVSRVADGEQALQYLRRLDQYSDQPQPDLIILDLNMPKMNGFEVIDCIKDDEVLRTIPVIVLTTSNAESDRNRAYQLHVNSYVVKPVDFGSFQQMINDLCQYWSKWNKFPNLAG